MDGKLLIEAINNIPLKINTKPNNVIGLNDLIVGYTDKIITNNIGYYNFFVYNDKISYLNPVEMQNLLYQSKYSEYLKYIIQFNQFNTSNIYEFLVTKIALGNQTSKETKGKILNPYFQTQIKNKIDKHILN